jgi:glutamine amidotransferase
LIAIIDYGAGNLFSVKNALNYLGEPNIITSAADEIRRADGLILPGVGAFPDAMNRLNDSGLVDVLREEVQNKPLLGICLGMQVLFEEGVEFKKTKGLGFIPGRVDLIRFRQGESYKLPHIGWNQLKMLKSSVLLKGLKDGDSVYFVHSYMAYTEAEFVSATCDYGTEITAFVERDNVYGAQFHPEKSGEVGLEILRNFGGLVK